MKQIVIENPRFQKMGYRTAGGFIGVRDRDTFSPLPEHISAKPEERSYLVKYDEFMSLSDNYVEMPYEMVALLVRFLEQGNGNLSK
ncbi:MAG: hypothetical protein JJU28_17880 [Cyclobacteriaceae bacterium]|nr:hypothetical protein [Cyclobacteriaceae bacterium]